MALVWRPAAWMDIEPGLAIQPKHRGDALVGTQAAIEVWKHLFHDPFFASAVLEVSPIIRGHSLVGFGASVFISAEFAGTEISNLRPDINSRLIAGIHAGRPVLATRNEVAQANAGEGVQVMILCGVWRDEIFNPAQRHEAQTLLASSFSEWHAGYRIRRILQETADEPAREFLRRSVVYEAIAEFPQLGRVIHMMTSESAKAEPASLGNILFSFREPVLHLRDSDQQLLLAARKGSTDRELTTELGVTLSAVKARWRSTFARIEDVMPALVSDVNGHDGRGAQKRHRVLAYVRNHPEEPRPYDWKRRTGSDSAIAITA